MNKKILGMKIGTIFMAFISLIVAVLIWFFVKYNQINSQEPATTAAIVSSEAHNEL